MAEIYLVRHGQASLGAPDYDQLSELGAEQCRLLGVWFGHCSFPIDQIVTGGMKRHLQSAQAFTGALSDAKQPVAKAIVDSVFDEFNHREMLSHYNPQLTDLDAVKRLLTENDNTENGFARLFSAAFARWIGGEHDHDYSEPWPRFSQRCNAAIARIAKNHPGKSTVVFTSGGAISAITQTLLGFPDTRVSGMNLILHNAGVTRVSAEAGNLALNYLNSCAHLEQHRQQLLLTRL